MRGNTFSLDFPEQSSDFKKNIQNANHMETNNETDKYTKLHIKI